MAESPVVNSGNIVYTKISIKGSVLGEQYGLSSIFVTKALNRIGKAIIKFDTGDIDTLSFPESDENTFKPGGDIKISAGYEKGKEEVLYEGLIVSQSLQLHGNVRPQLVVECRDYTFPATMGRKSTLFQKMSDSDIISDVLKKQGLSVSVDKTTVKHESLVQYYCSDWDFVRSRAEVCGLVIHSEGKTVQVKKPIVSGGPVFSVGYGKDLIEFNGSLSASDQFNNIRACAWDFSKQQLVSATASNPAINKQGDMSATDLRKAGGDELIFQSDAPIQSDYLKIWADAQALRSGLTRYQGDFSFNGHAAAKPGCLISLENMGKRFSGHVYVGGVEHTIERGQWITRVSMGLMPENITDLPDVTAPPASGLLPGIEGLHVGKIKEISDDPMKEYRMLVEIPLLTGNKQSVWARLSTLYATSKSGSFFLPEKGDEVVIGFFNNDPSHPVILGSLFSTKLTAPYKPESPNDMKAIISREQLKIMFDEKKKCITITTPGDNTIEISDDAKQIKLSDQHKNEILMNKSGITLQSAKDLTLKAKANIVLDAGMKAEMKAKTDMEMSGMNVKISAKVGATVKGTATAELSASGQTVVKGGIVMIN